MVMLQESWETTISPPPFPTSPFCYPDSLQPAFWAEPRSWSLCFAFGSESANWLDIACRHIVFGPHSSSWNLEFVASMKRIPIPGFLWKVEMGRCLAHSSGGSSWPELSCSFTLSTGYVVHSSPASDPLLIPGHSQTGQLPILVAFSLQLWFSQPLPE